jgi:2'-5' RNA ligase
MHTATGTYIALATPLKLMSMKNKGKRLYFVALVLPEPYQSEITELKHLAADLFGSSHALNSPAHITLIPPFFATEEEIENFGDKLQSFLQDKKIPGIHIQGAGHFGKRVIYANIKRNPALEKLQKDIFGLFRRFFPGINKSNRFHPHITIAFRDLDEDVFPEAWAYFSSMDIEGETHFDSIDILIHKQRKWNIDRKIKTANNKASN